MNAYAIGIPLAQTHKIKAPFVFYMTQISLSNGNDITFGWVDFMKTALSSGDGFHFWECRISSLEGEFHRIATCQGILCGMVNMKK